MSDDTKLSGGVWNYFSLTAAHMVNMLIIAICVYVVCFVGVSTYYYLKYGMPLLAMMEQGYTVTKTVDARVNGKVQVDAVLDEELQVPIRQDVHFAFPYQTTVAIPLNHTFQVPLKDMAVPLDHVFRLDEQVRIKADIPIETSATVNVLGQNITVPIKVVAPIDAVVPIKHDFHVRDTVLVSSRKPLDVPLEATFDVPLDLFLEGTIPLDEKMRIPLKTVMHPEVVISAPLPVTMDVNTVLNMKRETGLERDPGQSVKKIIP